MKDLQLSGEFWQGEGEEPSEEDPSGEEPSGEERSVEFSGHIILECEGCGEQLFLLGREEDWPKEHRDAFECKRCSKTVTLAHRIDSTAFTIKALLQSTIRPRMPGV